MNSKQKGCIGESMVLSEFAKRKIQCSIPYGDTARYDLVAEFNGRLNKIQVKYCNRLTSNGSVSCYCASSTNHTTNKHYTTYENDVDYFAFYLAPINKCILVPIKEVGHNKTISIRIRPVRNRQDKGIRTVEDYSFDKILFNN